MQNNFWESPGNLFFTIGPSRSGKTTFANRWAIGIDRNGMFSLNPRPRVIVSGDDIRKAITGKDFYLPAEAHVQASKFTMAKALISRGFDVLLDGTNTSKTSIQRIFEINVNAQPLIVGTPIEECKRRAIAEGKMNLLPVITRQFKNLETLMKNFEANLEEIRQSVLAESHLPPH